jgi:hypothetical protein
MRYLYVLVACIGLCAIPSIGRAAPALERPSQLVAPLPAAAKVPQLQRPDGPSAGSSSRAADNADDAARYAQREAQSGKALEYRGGDTVVIGSTAVVVILAIVLVVVLL